MGQRCYTTLIVCTVPDRASLNRPRSLEAQASAAILQNPLHMSASSVILVTAHEQSRSAIHGCFYRHLTEAHARRSCLPSSCEFDCTCRRATSWRRSPFSRSSRSRSCSRLVTDATAVCWAALAAAAAVRSCAFCEVRD